MKPVTRPRGVLSDGQAQQLQKLRADRDRTETEYRRAVVDALRFGGSFSEVSKATGLSKDTLQRWKKEVWRQPCKCATPSENLYGDTNGWHCQHCNGLVK